MCFPAASLRWDAGHTISAFNAPFNAMSGLGTPLSRIGGIPGGAAETLARAGFATTRELLSHSAFEVREICAVLPTETVALAMMCAARAAAPKRKTALQLLRDGAVGQGAAPQRIPTGLGDVDAALWGGLRVGTLSEVVGPNGVGKTQFVLQLCAAAGMHGDVLYFGGIRVQLVHR